MLNQQLLNPKSIVIVGGSNNLSKPGGRIVQNIINGGYNGRLYVVNPGDPQVQGISTFSDIQSLPSGIELAILAIPAAKCAKTASDLATLKQTKAFIVISAGFSEEGADGAEREMALKKVIAGVNGSLIGPNCIGMVTPAYSGIFTSPVPKLHPQGCDFVSGSGSTAVFILESALPKGLTFSSIITVGNSAQNGIEDVLENWDNTYHPKNSSAIKLIYVENIKDPDKLLKHATSLIRKGCRIAAIKSGMTEAGKRATSSHTGALASADSAVEALFRKAGIVRCFGREELVAVASVFRHKKLNGPNIAIITQAGGPGVMLTDALVAGGLQIPAITGAHQQNLLSLLHPGASANNPIDLLATGTAEQLEKVIDYCDQLDNIDGIMVIFGSTGLAPIFDAYEVIDRKTKECRKPIYPILPSESSAQREAAMFLSKGHVYFSDEVVLGRAITKIHQTPEPADDAIFLENINIKAMRDIIQRCPNGFQSPDTVRKLLQTAGIPIIEEAVVLNKKELRKKSQELGFPLAMKAVGPIHKSDVGGVTLNIKSSTHLLAEYHRMRKIKDVKSVLIQKMITGTELFIGAKYEPHFGHVMLCGLGGIFVESLNDISHGLAPLTFNEANSMIRSLKSYAVIKGTRGKQGIDESRYAEIIVRLSSMLRYATEIKEIDLNPLIGNGNNIQVVDARIFIKHINNDELLKNR